MKNSLLLQVTSTSQQSDKDVLQVCKKGFSNIQNKRIMSTALGYWKLTFALIWTKIHPAAMKPNIPMP